jgi:hypothetical protein
MSLFGTSSKELIARGCKPWRSSERMRLDDLSPLFPFVPFDLKIFRMLY